MDTLRSEIDRAARTAIEAGATPGAVVLVRLRNQVVHHAAYGSSLTHQTATTRAPSPITAQADTIYDLASLSKLFTATCLVRLAEDGKLSLDEPVAKWLPEFAANGKAALTVRQVITHSAGLPSFLPLWQSDPTREARLTRALEVAPTAAPGTRVLYSDLGLIALGQLVERIYGAALDRAVAELVMLPLRLSQTRYRPPADLRPRIAPTEFQESTERGLVWGEVHDENAWALGGVAGHAGLFGTAADVGVFGQVFLDSGALGGRRLLRPESVAEMTRSQVQPHAWRGLGWELNAGYFMGRLARPETFGHTGFPGTSLVVDPAHTLVVVVLTNRVHPSREGPSINPLRQAVANAALAAAERSA